MGFWDFRNIFWDFLDFLRISGIHMFSLGFFRFLWDFCDFFDLFLFSQKSGLEEHQRRCPFCETIVETEQHFLLECNTFGFHRTQFFTEIGEINPEFSELDEEQKFCYLLSEPDVARLVGSHLNKTPALRRFLLEHLRQTD